MFMLAGHPHALVKSLAALAACAWVLPLGPTAIRAILERSFADPGLAFPANVVETTSVFAALSLVMHADRHTPRIFAFRHCGPWTPPGGTARRP